MSLCRYVANVNQVGSIYVFLKDFPTSMFAVVFISHFFRGVVGPFKICEPLSAREAFPPNGQRK